MSRKRQNQPQQQPNAPRTPADAPVAGAATPPGARQWLFRVGALVLAPVLVFLCLEGGLLLAGYGYSTSFFLERKTDDGHNVLVENEKFSRPFFGALARVPFPTVLSAQKPANTCRIFVFGESAAYGDPLPEFGLCRLLEALFGLRYPGTRFEVVNAAMTAINSHVILPIARDCARQNGDLWVVYIGNNEVVGPFGSGTVFGGQAPPLAAVRASIALKRTRTGQLLEAAIAKAKQSTNTPSEWGGMTMFLHNQVRRDDPKMERVYSHFSSNLRDIIAAGTGGGAKIVLSTVACNLSDCPPFASAHRDGLSESQLAEWDRLFKAGADAETAGKTAEAHGFFRDVAKIDDHHAELRFRLARCCLALGREAEAQNEFAAARDLDTLRFRADSRINELIRQSASGREKDGVVLADAERDLARRSPHAICGSDLFYEHVHLTFEGNYWLARDIAEKAAPLLPASVTRQDNSDWPTLEQCAQRLAWTDWNGNEAARDILMRISDPPFSAQMNHDDQASRLRTMIEKTSGPDVARKAFAVYKNAVASAPNDWQLQSSYGRVARKVGDLDSATAAWRQADQLLPLHTACHYQLGQLFNHRKMPEDAIAEFEAALRVKPEYADAMVGWGMALVQKGKLNDAIKQYQKALKANPHAVEAHLNLAAVLDGTGRAAEATEHYRTATDHAPLNVDGLLTLGQVCVRHGWTAKAVERFALAVRLDPADGRARFFLATVLAMTGRSDEAFTQFQQAVKFTPGSAEAHLGLGIELGKRGNHAEAVEQFAAAVKLNPNLVEAHLNLGTALGHQGKRDEALAEYHQALRIDPQNPRARAEVERLGKP